MGYYCVGVYCIENVNMEIKSMIYVELIKYRAYIITVLQLPVSSFLVGVSHPDIHWQFGNLDQRNMLYYNRYIRLTCNIDVNCIGCMHYECLRIESTRQHCGIVTKEIPLIIWTNIAAFHVHVKKCNILQIFLQVTRQRAHQLVNIRQSRYPSESIRSTNISCCCV